MTRLKLATLLGNILYIVFIVLAAFIIGYTIAYCVWGYTIDYCIGALINEIK